MRLQIYLKLFLSFPKTIYLTLLFFFFFKIDQKIKNVFFCIRKTRFSQHFTIFSDIHEIFSLKKIRFSQNFTILNAGTEILT